VDELGELQVAGWRVAADERGEAICGKGVLDSADPFGALGMP
jgi:hypothetical protein